MFGGGGVWRRGWQATATALLSRVLRLALARELAQGLSPSHFPHQMRGGCTSVRVKRKRLAQPAGMGPDGLVFRMTLGLWLGNDLQSRSSDFGLLSGFGFRSSDLFD